STISNVPLTGTDLSGVWQLMVIDSQSVLNTIDVGASNITVVRDSYLANKQATIKSMAAGGTNIVLVESCYILIGASNPNFLNLTKLNQFASIKNCFVLAADGTNTFLVNVTNQNNHSSVLLEAMHRSATTIRPEAS